MVQPHEKTAPRLDATHWHIRQNIKFWALKVAQSGMFEPTGMPKNDHIFFFEIHVPGHLFRMGDAFGAFLGHMIFWGRVTLTHPP